MKPLQKNYKIKTFFLKECIIFAYLFCFGEMDRAKNLSAPTFYFSSSSNLDCNFVVETHGNAASTLITKSTTVKFIFLHPLRIVLILICFIAFI